MKTIKNFGSLIVAFTLLSTLALAAPKAERSNKSFKVAGSVIQIDKKDRTLLVSDRLSNKLYLIAVPEGATFKITFGRYMNMGQPGFKDVRTGEQVEVKCTRGSTEHIARLDDGRSVVTLTAAR